MPILRYLLIPFMFAAFWYTGTAQQRFPFTREENSDGSKFVWFVYNLQGYSYGYKPAKTFPTSPRFIRLGDNDAQESDIAWWSGFMGIYGGDSAGTVMTAEGTLPLGMLVKKYGPVKWFSYLHGDPLPLGISLFGGRLTFTLPDSLLWKQSDQQFNQLTQKGMIMFEREAIVDTGGTEVRPIMSIIYEQLPTGVSGSAAFANVSPRPDGMNINSIDTANQSLLYHCSYNNGADHTVLILYMAGEDTGISVICDATTSVYDTAQKEFFSFLESVEYKR